MDKNLAGVWTWFVDSDDFRGYCKPDTKTFADFPNTQAPVREELDYPLLRTINEAMELLSVNDSIVKGNGLALSNSNFDSVNSVAPSKPTYSLHDVLVFSP